MVPSNGPWRHSDRVSAAFVRGAPPPIVLLECRRAGRVAFPMMTRASDHCEGSCRFFGFRVWLKLFWLFLRINLLTSSGPASVGLLYKDAVGRS